MDISRRKLLEIGMLGTGSILFPSLLSADETAFDSRFPASIMKGSLEDSSGQMQVFSGALPVDIYGHLMMMEGMPNEEDHFSVAGKGAITRFDFTDDGNVGFVRKLIKTPQVYLQDQLGSSRDQFRLLGGVIYLSPTLGFMNYCNTVPIAMGDNRFCMGFEGGTPFEFDASTLEVSTPVGTPDEWITSLPSIAAMLSPKRWLFPQVRGTAHAYFDDRTDEGFFHNYGGNVGESGKGFLRVMKWDKKGKLISKNVIGRDGKAASLVATGHSFGITRNHIIIYDNSTRIEGSRILGLRTIEAQKNQIRIWVMKRAEFAKNQDWIAADTLILNFDASDVMVDYDDFDNVITFYAQYLSATDKSEPMYAREKLLFGGKVRPELGGYVIAPLDVGGVVRAAVQVTTQGLREIKEFFHVTTDPKLTWDMNDPAYRGAFYFPDRFEHIYWSAVGYRPEHVVVRAAEAYKNYPRRQLSNDALPREAIGSALLHQDCKTMEIVDSYSFPAHMVMRSPQFVQKKGDLGSDATNGYIACGVVVNTAFETNPSARGKELWIFDAQNLKQGPLCRLHHPDLNFATTNHMLWTPSIGPRPADAYKADLRPFFEERLSQHSSQVVSIVKKEIYPRFL